jgi:hypothetical protein
MKAEWMNVTLEDRPATWDEIRRAEYSSPDHALELRAGEEGYFEMDSDLGGVIRYSTQEFEFFYNLSEMDEAKPN